MKDSPSPLARDRSEDLSPRRSRPGPVRRRFSLLAALIVIGTVAPGRPHGLQAAALSRQSRGDLSVEATLRGYFLTPQGQLEPRTVPLITTAGKPQEAVHPLPSGYYLAVTAKSSRSPIVQAEVRTFRGRKRLIAIPVEPPSSEVRLPPEERSWLGVRPEEGLAFRVTLHLADGRRVDFPLHPEGLRLLPMAPLRVNWLDLVRIEEARRLLNALGDEILPGFRADDVPFALLGENGQCVLINHPHPPRGFRRYHGPCPVRGRVDVGPLPWSGNTPHTAELGGTPTATFPYDPAWFALPEAPVSKRDEDEAIYRFEVILHEACHVAWIQHTGQSVRAEPAAMEGPSVEAVAVEEAEREVLTEAVDCLDRDPQKARTLVRDYLALREYRRERDAVSSSLVSAQELSETTEGFAYFAMWHAGEVAQGRYDFALLQRADPFLEEFQPKDPLSMLEPDEELRSMWAPGLSLSTYPSYYGACQARLIQALHPEALLAAWQQGTLLRPALSRVVGYDALSADQRDLLKKEAVERWQCAEREASLRQIIEQGTAAQWHAATAALQGQGILLRVRAELFPARQHSAPTPPWRFSNAYVFSTMGSAVECDQPCLVRSTFTRDEGRLELQTVLPNEELLILQRTGRSTRLRAGKVVIEADRIRLRGGRSSSLITVECQPAAPAAGADSEKGEPTMKIGKFSVMPLLAAWLAGPGLAQLAHHEVTFTLSGVFLNADTGQQQNGTLDLLAEAENPTGNWYLIAGQTYSATASMTDASYGRISRVALYGPDGALLDEATSAPPTAHLTATGTFRAVQAMKVSGKIGIKHTANCHWEITGEVTISREPPPQPPQPQGGTINVVVADGTNPAVLRVQGATVAVWIDGHPDEKQEKLTDAQGLATFPNMASGKYLTEVRGPGQRCVIRRGPYQLRKNAQLNEVVLSWPHCGITGKVWFKNQQGQTVPGPADKVKVELFQGGQSKGGLVVGTQPQADGSYPYSGPPGGPPAAGSYTVKATFTPGMGAPQERQQPVTVPDECGPAHPDQDGGTTVMNPGAHAAVPGPEFTFTLPGGPGG
jgi:hypothetical protein